MIKILIYIKHKLPFIWRMIDCLNAFLFRLLFSRRFNQSIIWAFNEFKLPGFEFRLIESDDLREIKKLIDKQAIGRLEYFKPHKFHLKALKRVQSNPAFVMIGAFEHEEIVGYFFLRCFWNRKCFVGRIIDEPYEGKGIGRVMNNIMYNIAWRSNFRCLSTISKNNQAVMRSHASNKAMKILQELKDDYLLVEFVNPTHEI